jgi:hypothetical protein
LGCIRHGAFQRLGQTLQSYLIVCSALVPDKTPRRGDSCERPSRWPPPNQTNAILKSWVPVPSRHSPKASELRHYSAFVSLGIDARGRASAQERRVSPSSAPQATPSTSPHCTVSPATICVARLSAALRRAGYPKDDQPLTKMTDAQKLLIALLVVIGLVLAYNMLDWTSQFGHAIGLQL